MTATARRPATERQIALLLKLAREHQSRGGADADTRERLVREAIPALNTRTASEMIDEMLRLPVRQAELVQCVAHPGTHRRQLTCVDPHNAGYYPEQPRPAVSRSSGDTSAVTPGVYRREDGTVFSVRVGRQSGRPYALRMVEIGGRRLTEADTTVQVDFEYEASAISTLRPEHRLSVEETEALSIRYGRCLLCSHRLKAADSVKRGIGPVCRKRQRS